jgi:paraquat-inducible protein A
MPEPTAGMPARAETGRTVSGRADKGGLRLGGRRFLLSLAIVGACVCLALGVTLPIIKLTKFFFWTNEHSLLSTVQTLMKDGQRFLAITVFIFSILLPVLKLFYLLLLSTLPKSELQRRRRQLGALEWLGRWSMHDVLVLSITIFYLKSSGVYDAASLNGVYFFTAAVMFMILGFTWIGHDTRMAEEAKPPAPPQPALDASGKPRRRPIFWNFFLSFFIIMATVFFALGVILPAIKFTTVYVWTNQHSVASIIWALYKNGELFLCFVVFMFSVFFPFLKLFYLLTLTTSPDLSPEFRKKSMRTMEWLGRYSMTDVMVLALMIFYINSSGYTEATVLPGIYFFAASALMTMLAYGWANSVPFVRGPEAVAVDATKSLPSVHPASDSHPSSRARRSA